MIQKNSFRVSNNITILVLILMRKLASRAGQIIFVKFFKKREVGTKQQLGQRKGGNLPPYVLMAFIFIKNQAFKLKLEPEREQSY